MNHAAALTATPDTTPPWLAILAAAALASLLLCAQFGAVDVRGADWLAPLRLLLAGTGNGEAAPGLSGSAHVLWQIRLPRALFAAGVGAALGLTGALAQGLFRNPLADPGLLGVTGGAACAAALTLVAFAGLQAPLPIEWRPCLLPLAAFAGALAVSFLLDRTARWLAPGSIAALLLTGVALNAVAASVIGLCTYAANDEQLRSLTFWLMGSLAGASWPLATAMALLAAGAAWCARPLAGQLNALALGEAAALHVGIDVRRLRARTGLLVALACGFAVAWCGMISFLGLIAPHLARGLVGPDQRRLMPAAALAGALLLLLADTAARTLFVPAEVPVGIFTALLGGPFFIALLRGVARRQGDAA